MKTIQINYDLHNSSKYADVEAYIKTFARWDHLLESTWLVQTTKTVAAVRDDLMRIVGPGGGNVAVFDVTGVAWATNWSDSRTNWLRDAA